MIDNQIDNKAKICYTVGEEREMTLNKENAFVGAKVVYNKEVYTVVKVNTKTVYVSLDTNFIKKWEDGKKGTTWKEFCEKNGAFMVDIYKIEISDYEASRKEIEVNKVKKASKEKKRLTKIEESILKDYWMRVISEQKGFPYKSYKGFPIEGAKHTFMILRAEPDHKWFLVKDCNANDYFFFNVITEEYVTFIREKNVIGKDIVWPVSKLQLSTTKSA